MAACAHAHMGHASCPTTYACCSLLDQLRWLEEGLVFSKVRIGGYEQDGGQFEVRGRVSKGERERGEGGHGRIRDWVVQCLGSRLLLTGGIDSLRGCSLHN